MWEDDAVGAHSAQQGVNNEREIGACDTVEEKGVDRHPDRGSRVGRW